MPARYLVGIDLGTTNTACAWVDTASGREIQVFEIPQLVAPGEMRPRATLPSFTYLAGPHELPPGSLDPPWAGGRDWCVGLLAREQGTRVAGRLVASAKSWLCHGGVDREAEILPWGAPREVPRVSPVEATTAYLAHIRDAWNETFATSDPAARLEDQEVVLTVPASFDEAARELTVEGARRAGLKQLTLLEEHEDGAWSTRATFPFEGRG